MKWYYLFYGFGVSCSHVWCLVIVGRVGIYGGLFVVYIVLVCVDDYGVQWMNACYGV